MFFQLVRAHTCWTVLIGGSQPTRFVNVYNVNYAQQFQPLKRFVYFGLTLFIHFCFWQNMYSQKKKKIIISPPFYKKYLWLFTKQHYVNARRFRGILRELDGLTSMDLILLFYFFSEISKTINTRHRNNNDTSPYLLVHWLFFGIHYPNHFMTFLY